MRVLMIGPHLDYPGGIPSVERVMLRHVPAGLELRFAGTVHQGSAMGKMTSFALGYLRCLGILLSWRPDVAHVHFSKSGSAVRKALLTSLCRSCGVPVVLHAHSGAFDRFWEARSPFVRSWMARRFGRASLVLVQSADWVPFFADAFGVPSDRIFDTGNPVEVRQGARRSRDGAVGVLFLGGMGKLKGVYDLVEAVAEVADALRPTAHVTMAGDGDVDGVTRLAVELGVSDLFSIRRWLGPDERDDALDASDVFVLPSYSEALPMSLLEAMAAGLVPIVTAVGAIPQVVNDGENGIVIAPGDRQALGAALTRLVSESDERVRMGDAARASATRYEVHAYMDRLMHLYRLAITPGTRS